MTQADCERKRVAPDSIGFRGEVFIDAKRYRHSASRVDTRVGHYERQPHTKAGEMAIKVPKLRSLPFESDYRALQAP